MDIYKKSKGEVSAILLILGVVLLILIVVVFVFIRTNAAKNADKIVEDTPVVTGPPEPVYETSIGDVKFTFISAQDWGSVLVSERSIEENLSTTEKFIRVTVGAQNKGKSNISRGLWDLGNIVDGEGRNFVSINDQAYSFLPKPNTCGYLLKPEFEAIPCVKFYEVAKGSENLSIEVNFTPPDSSKKVKAYLDLDVR